MTKQERVPHIELDCAGRCGRTVRRRASDVARLTTGRVFCGRDCPGSFAPKATRGVELTCPGCGGSFYRRPSAATTKSGAPPCCSSRCAALQRTPKLGEGPTRITTTCGRCGTQFEHPRSQQGRRYCSTTCAGNADTQTELACANCGGLFWGRPSEGRRFCSQSCFRELQTAEAEGSIDENGYRWIYVDGKRIYEHRHVMSLAIGRELRPEETVHHRNGDKLANRADNLELWVSRHPKGQRVSDLIEFAEAILADYGPERAALARIAA